jgi:hypothetical protein
MSWPGKIAVLVTKRTRRYVDMVSFLPASELSSLRCRKATISKQNDNLARQVWFAAERGFTMSS